jgi:hypothetical protein
MSSAARPWRPRFSPLKDWASVGGRAVQARLRRAFCRWGRPGALRVDNGVPWAAARADLPTELALWLTGLGVGVHYNPPRQPRRNGVVERSQGVAKAWAEPHTCAGPRELQRRLERMDEIQRAEYPSCEGRSRLEAHPGLAHSGRAYDAAWERRHWDLQRVLEHLAGFTVPRRVRGGGMVSVYERDHYVRQRDAGRVVYVQFDPVAREWVCTDEHDRQLRRWPAPEISRARIRRLDVNLHR